MKVFMYVWAALFALTALHSRAELSKADTAGIRFHSGVSNWVEGTITGVTPDGKVVMTGMPSAYAANYAEFHRQYYGSAPEKRETERRALTEKFRSKLAYGINNDYAETYTFIVPSDKFSIFDESARYGVALDTWRYIEEPVIYHQADLKAGQRYVVGFDSDKNVLSMFRLNPIAVLSGENPNKLNVPPGNERNIKDGVHIMNLSSNETNPPPRIPNQNNTATTRTPYDGNYGYSYPAVVPPVRSGATTSSTVPGVQPAQIQSGENPSNTNPTVNTLPTNNPPNSSVAPTLPPNTNSTNSTATTPSVLEQNQQATNAIPNTPQSSVNGNGNNGTNNITNRPNPNPTPSRPLSPQPAPHGPAPVQK